MLRFRVLKFFGAVVVSGLMSTLVSGNAAGHSAIEPVGQIAIAATIPALLFDDRYSPLASSGTFSSLKQGDPIVEDLSPQPVTEPLITLLAASDVTVSKGTVRALVINIQLANGTVADRGLLASSFQAAVEGMRNMSRGMLDVQVDYFGRNVVVDVSDGSDICELSNYYKIATEAMAQAATELNLDNYRFISFVIPEVLKCSFAGRGQRPGQLTWIVGSNASARTIDHEWGHNLSLNHSNAMRCSVNNVAVQFASRALRDQGACVEKEYGGPYSVMGAASGGGALMFIERLQMGWLRTDEFQSAHQGTYTLNYDAAPALLMLQNSEGDIFMIEYGRAPQCGQYGSKFCAYDSITQQWIPGPFANGVIVHYVSKYENFSNTPSGYAVTSSVLDMNLSTPHRWDSTLQAGQSFVDPTGTLQIDVTSVGENSAVVNVRGIPFRPDTPTNFVVTPQATLGLVNVTWTGVVATSPVTHYELQISSQSDFAASTTTKFGITSTSGTVSIPNARYNTKYWSRVAAVNTVGISDFAQLTTPASWKVVSTTAKIGSACTSLGARAITPNGKRDLVCKLFRKQMIWKNA